MPDPNYRMRLWTIRDQIRVDKWRHRAWDNGVLIKDYTTWWYSYVYLPPAIPGLGSVHNYPTDTFGFWDISMNPPFLRSGGYFSPTGTLTPQGGSPSTTNFVASWTQFGSPWNLASPDPYFPSRDALYSSSLNILTQPASTFQLNIQSQGVGSALELDMRWEASTSTPSPRFAVVSHTLQTGTGGDAVGMRPGMLFFGDTGYFDPFIFSAEDKVVDNSFPLHPIGTPDSDTREWFTLKLQSDYLGFEIFTVVSSADYNAKFVAGTFNW